MGMMKRISTGRMFGGARNFGGSVAGGVPGANGPLSGGIDFNWFFDRDHVKAEMAKHGRTYLSKGGLFVKQRAKKGIKKKGLARGKLSERTKKGRLSVAYLRQQQEIRNRPASPKGTPPFTHTGFLRGDIYHAYDPARRTAVIGPSKVPWLNRLHEFGGTRQTPASQRKPNWMLEIGGHGPIGISGTQIRFAKLTTERQVAKARQLAAQLDTTGFFTKKPKPVRTYPARPFMKPALRDFEGEADALWNKSLLGSA